MVAIVGYTNAGKSTLLNRLADADVLVEDKLFATLDPTTRRSTLPSGKEVLVYATRSASSKSCPPSWWPLSAPPWKRCGEPIS